MAGSIRQRGRNSWQIRVYAGTDPGTGHRRQLTRTVQGSRTQAERELRSLTAFANVGHLGVVAHEAHSDPAGVEARDVSSGHDAAISALRVVELERSVVAGPAPFEDRSVGAITKLYPTSHQR